MYIQIFLKKKTLKQKLFLLQTFPEQMVPVILAEDTGLNQSDLTTIYYPLMGEKVLQEPGRLTLSACLHFFLAGGTAPHNHSQPPYSCSMPSSPTCLPVQRKKIRPGLALGLCFPLGCPLQGAAAGPRPSKSQRSHTSASTANLLTLTTVLQAS